METSNYGQRALLAFSVMLVATTVAVSWWVSQPIPQRRTQGEVTHQVDPPEPLPANQWEVGSPEESRTPLKLAAYEQPPSELAPPPGLPVTGTNPPPRIPGNILSDVRIPSDGVQVPPANQGMEPAPREGVIQYRGVLSFVHDVKVVAQADGVIQEFHVDEGSIVEKDSIIVEIDNRLAKAEQEIAQRELESAMLKAEDESQIKFSMASEEVARSDFARIEELYRQEVSTIDEYERKRLELIKSGFQIDVSKREQKINQAAVGVNQAKWNAAGVQVELRTIRAPFSGIVAKTDRERFEWVKAGDEILRLVALDSFRVKGRVRIVDSPNILDKAPARVFIQIRPGQIETVDGVVGFVEPETSGAVDGRNEYAVWVEIPNRVVNGQYLFRGKMDATVEIYPNP